MAKPVYNHIDLYSLLLIVIWVLYSSLFCISIGIKK